jgi:blue light- and temperature-responsive anti-repressor
MALFRLIYHSETNFPLAGASGRDMFRKILEATARHNMERGITGALIFDWDHFLQVLEGDPEKVNQTFIAIAQDRRHKHVMLTEAGPIDARAFSCWSMVHIQDRPDMKTTLMRYLPDTHFKPQKCNATALLSMCKDLVALKPAPAAGLAPAA